MEMENNKEPKTKTKTKAQKKARAMAQSWSPSRCSAGWRSASKGILPALLLLAAPFSGADTPAFSHMKDLNSGLEQCRHYLDE
jgi:hypothetical protein